MPESELEPEYSCVAESVVVAYNMIARARQYEQCTPLPLHTGQITSYLELNDSPCELHIFIDCIFAIDNLFLDNARRQQKLNARKR